MLSLLVFIIAFINSGAQSNMCLWGRKSTHSVVNGQFVQSSNFNARESWKMSTESGCGLDGMDVYLFYNGSNWVLNTQRVSPSTSDIAYCTKSGSDPISCNGKWIFDKESEPDEEVIFSDGDCPELNCTIIETNIGNDCNGPFINIDNVANAWTNAAQDLYFYFNAQLFQWVCDTEFTKQCKETSTYNAISTDGWTYADQNIVCSKSVAPTEFPSRFPTQSPSRLPTKSPSFQPSESPSNVPSTSPTKSPSMIPSESPSKSPSNMPSNVPTDIPTKVPSVIPTMIPTQFPFTSMEPSVSPSNIPSVSPTRLPSQRPSAIPTVSPDEVTTEPLEHKDEGQHSDYKPSKNGTSLESQSSNSDESKFMFDSLSITICVAIVTVGCLCCACVLAIYKIISKQKRRISKHEQVTKGLEVCVQMSEFESTTQKNQVIDNSWMTGNGGLYLNPVVKSNSVRTDSINGNYNVNQQSVDVNTPVTEITDYEGSSYMDNGYGYNHDDQYIVQDNENEDNEIESMYDPNLKRMSHQKTITPMGIFNAPMSRGGDIVRGDTVNTATTV